MSFGDIYKGKVVLVSGHAGFKGAWLSYWLSQLGANVVGYSLMPETEFTLFDVLGLKDCLQDSIIADICDTQKLNSYFNKHKPDMLFHLAAQPLVRYSYQYPVRTYQTNVMGTLNMLEAARNVGSVKTFVNVTTDKCYENKEVKEAYTENNAMGGYDMYSSSKGCSELLTASYRRSFLSESGYLLASARAGNVIGGGDWAVDRLVPDCIRALVKRQTIVIRNPVATRPWQHVLEPLAGYLLLGQTMYERGRNFASGYNFGPEMDTDMKVCEVAKKVVDFWGEGSIEVMPNSTLHEATLLQLNIDKAKKELGFKPVWDTDNAIENTVKWYKAFYSKEDMLAFTKKQIDNFVEDARKKQAVWSK